MKDWKQQIFAHSEVNPLQTLVEICGTGRVLIECHHGVVEYHRDRILVKVGFGYICVLGSGLQLRQMTKQQLVICGAIESVSLQREGR